MWLPFHHNYVWCSPKHGLEPVIISVELFSAEQKKWTLSLTKGCAGSAKNSYVRRLYLTVFCWGAGKAEECILDHGQCNKITFNTHLCQSCRALLMDDKGCLNGRRDLVAQRKGGPSLVWHQEGYTLDLTALIVQIRVRDELQILPYSLTSSFLSSATSNPVYFLQYESYHLATSKETDSAEKYLPCFGCNVSCFCGTSSSRSVPPDSRELARRPMSVPV